MSWRLDSSVIATFASDLYSEQVLFATIVLKVVWFRFHDLFLPFWICFALAAFFLKLLFKKYGIYQCSGCTSFET